jgi:hypothetical protein
VSEHIARMSATLDRSRAALDACVNRLTGAVLDDAGTDRIVDAHAAFGPSESVETILDAYDADEPELVEYARSHPEGHVVVVEAEVVEP